MKNTPTFSNDVLGISSAFLCLVHCLVFPMLSFLPLAISHNHWVDLLFASIGIFALIKILKSNSKSYIKFILTVSMVLILCSILYTLCTQLHTKLLYVGGIGMIIGHLLNFKNHTHK